MGSKGVWLRDSITEAIVWKGFFWESCHLPGSLVHSSLVRMNGMWRMGITGGWIFQWGIDSQPQLLLAIKYLKLTYSLKHWKLDPKVKWWCWMQIQRSFQWESTWRFLYFEYCWIDFQLSAECSGLSTERYRGVLRLRVMTKRVWCLWGVKYAVQTFYTVSGDNCIGDSESCALPTKDWDVLIGGILPK